MSAAPASGRARLEQLSDDFHDGALRHSAVDAVVVYEPDLRSKDTRRQVCEHRLRRRHCPEPDVLPSAPRRDAADLDRHLECSHDDWRAAFAMDEWIPPGHEGLNQLGLTSYREYQVIGHVEDGPGAPAGRTVWKCDLFGPAAGGAGETAARFFEALASRASRLILRGNGKGKCPTSGWLIHLADRDEPLHSRSGKQYLTWSLLSEPVWARVNPRRPWCWWAVRLSNVFQYSRDAVEQFIDSADWAPARVRCDEPDRSVHLDGKRLVGEVELTLFRCFKVISEAYPDPVPFKKIQQLVPGLHGKHPTRDFKNRLPAQLHRLVESSKHGYSLKLPVPKSPTTVHTS